MYVWELQLWQVIPINEFRWIIVLFYFAIQFNNIVDETLITAVNGEPRADDCVRASLSRWLGIAYYFRRSQHWLVVDFVDQIATLGSE